MAKEGSLRHEYANGKVVIFNILDDNTNDTYSVEKVTHLPDGTPLNDSIVDALSPVFERNHDGEYFKRVNVSSINYKMIGVKGDGIADDGILIRKAHHIANTLKVPVINKEGEYWLKAHNVVTIKTSVDWGKSIFHIDESKTVALTPRFHAINDEDQFSITLSPTVTAKIKKGVRQIPELSIYEGCFIVIEDKNSAIRRNGGSGGDYYKTEMFYVAESGVILGDIYWDFTSYTSIVVRRVPKDLTLIQGGSFYLNGMPNMAVGNTYMMSGFLIERAGTLLVGQSLQLEPGANPSGMVIKDLGFFLFRNTYNVELQNAKGIARKELDNGTYGIGARYVQNLRLTNVVADADETYWGTMGGFHVKDLVVNNCHLSRLDVHFNACNITIQSLRTRSIAVCGFGLLYIRDAKVFGDYLTYVRQDFGGTWDGDIDIANAKLYPTNHTEGVQMALINFATAEFNYNYPIVWGRNIKIENIEVDFANSSSTGGTIHSTKMAPFSKLPESNIRIQFPETIDISNVKVKGRESGVSLMSLGNISDFFMEKSGGDSSGGFFTNTVWNYKNIDTVKTSTLLLGAYSTARDENTIYPEINIERCEVDYRGNNAMANVNFNKATVLFFRAVGASGANVISQSDIKLDRLDVTLAAAWASDNDKTYFINCTWFTPSFNGNKAATASELNSLMGQTISIPAGATGFQVYKNHINSRLSVELLSIINSLSSPTTAMLNAFRERINYNYNARQIGVSIPRGTTALTPAAHSVNDIYYDTTMGSHLFSDGVNWSKPLAREASQAEVDAGTNSVKAVTSLTLEGKLKKGVVAEITTTDATDEATAIALANSNKAKINEIIAKLSTIIFKA